MAKRRPTIANCKLVNLRLFESSSKLLDDGSGKTGINVTLNHEVSFSALPDEENTQFSLHLDTKLTGLREESQDECFSISSKFRADYKIIDSDKYKPDQFEYLIEELGHQLFPSITYYVKDMLVRMGLPPTFPWSLKTVKLKRKNEQEDNINKSSPT